jgi:hypothetical protein
LPRSIFYREFLNLFVDVWQINPGFDLRQMQQMNKGVNLGKRSRVILKKAKPVESGVVAAFHCLRNASKSKLIVGRP